MAFTTFHTLLRDPRHFQIAWLSIFLVAGQLWLGWALRPLVMILTISTALLVEIAHARLVSGRRGGWKSALITGLGLCLLLKVNAPVTAVVAAVVAIGSKFALRVDGKHIFNPANLGIVAAVVLTGDAWVSPGQWGSHAILLFAVGGLGFLVLRKVDRLDTTLTFLAVFGGSLVARNVLYLGWPMDLVIHQMTSGTIMLFACFMITDPKTTPDHRIARMIWAAGIGLASFALSSYGYVYSAPIWALVAASPLVPVLDRLARAPRFQWHPTSIVHSSNQSS